MESSLNPAPFLLVIELPGLPPTANARSPGNLWKGVKERKAWREAVARIARLRRPPAPLTRVSLTCIRYSPVSMDYDNRVACFKPLIDGLKDAGVILDDNDNVVLQRYYPPGRAKRGEGKVRIEIRELTDHDLNRCLFCGK